VAWILDVVASTGSDLVEPVLPSVMANDADLVEDLRGVIVLSLMMDAVSACSSLLALCFANSAVAADLRDQEEYHGMRGVPVALSGGFGYD
jgi:hypothetical protein